MPNRRSSIGLLAAIAATIVLSATAGGAAIFDFPRFGVDDANITMVYARNLADGHGFVFTPGYERVEGFTSLGWTLLVAGAFLVSDAPEPLILGISVLLCGFSVFAVLRIVSLLTTALPSPDRHNQMFGAPVLLALVWLVGIPGFYVWNTIALMDLSLWTALVHAAALLLVLDVSTGATKKWIVWALGCVTMALVMSRPEAIAVAPGLLGLAIVMSVDILGDWRRAAARFVPAGTMCLLALVGITVFRLAYFGYPLPNTYYAKVSPDSLYTATEGIKYIWRFLLWQPTYILLLAVNFVAGVYTASRGSDRTVGQRIVFVTSCIVLGGMALPLAGGGDHFGSFRFLQPFVPLMIVPLTYGFAQMLMREDGLLAPPRIRKISVLAILVASAIWPFASWSHFKKHHEIDLEFVLARRYRELADAINLVFPQEPRPRIGAVVTGALGLGYDGRLVDLMGLNWSAMGHSTGDRKGLRDHSAFNEDVFWSAPPDFVEPLNTTNVPQQVDVLFATLYLNEIHRTSRFRSAYQPGYYRTSIAFVSGFFSKTWLETGAPPGFIPLPWTDDVVP